MTGTEIINGAQDTTGATLYGKLNALSGAVLRAINDAQRQLCALRASALIDDYGNPVAFADITAAGETLVVPDRFKPAMVAFLISKVYRCDQENKRHDELAEKHMQEFVALAKAL